MRQYVEWAAAAAGFASAALWLMASKGRIAWPAMGTLAGPAVVVLHQLSRQTMLNSLAAFFSGISAALQGVALCLP
jgi:hypothetical protein